MILPFGILLATIALAPLFFAGWWHNHYSKVAYALGAVTLMSYFAGLNAYGGVGQVALEYVSFIVLICSLFVVSGGIHIQVRCAATPLADGRFLLVGCVSADLCGTAGGSLARVRPSL